MSAGEDSGGLQQEGAVSEAGPFGGSHTPSHGKGTQDSRRQQGPVCIAAMEHLLLSIRW